MPLTQDEGSAYKSRTTCLIVNKCITIVNLTLQAMIKWAKLDYLIMTKIVCYCCEDLTIIALP